MATIPAILLSLLLSAAEPLSDAELETAVTALEESLSRYTAIEATYSVRHEFKPNRFRPPGMVPPDPATISWIWTDSRERFSMDGADARGPVTTEVLFDGAKTYQSDFMPPDSEHWDRVLISSGSPDPNHMVTNYLSFFTGHRLFHRSDNLISLIAKARSEGALSGTKSEDVWTIGVGTVEGSTADYRDEVDLDPAADLRIAAIRKRELETDKKFYGRHWEFVVEEFQSVVDVASGHEVWFPRRGHFEMPGQITYIDVAAVRINHAVPAETFRWREPKAGTTVQDSTVPGSPKIWTVGGEAAEQARLKQIIAQAEDMAEAERERLKAEGVRANASPPSGSGRWFWIGIGCFILVSVLILSRYLERRAG